MTAKILTNNIKHRRTLFLKFFGVTAQTKILDFLLETFPFYYSPVLISHETGVPLKKVNDFIYLLKQYKMVTPHKDDKKRYTVNKKSHLIKSLVEFDFSLAFDASLMEKEDTVI
jgi:hypothetical protein